MEKYSELLCALAGAVVGAVVGGLFTIGVQSSIFRHENKKIIDKDKQDELGLLQALHDEMDVLWKRYSRFMGSDVENLPEKTAFLIYYPINQDYFPVYRGNTANIGRIQNSDLRHLIVSVYTEAMGMVDTFKMNNELVRQYQHWDSVHQSSGKDSDGQLAIKHLQPCINYAAPLKQSHSELKVNVNKLLLELRKYIHA